MPQLYKILGQANPSAGTSMTTLYTVPSSTTCVVSSLTVANLGSASTTYRIAVRPASATAVANQHYLALDASLPGNDTTVLTFGASMEQGAVVSVACGSTQAAFSLFGCEIT